MKYLIISLLALFIVGCGARGERTHIRVHKRPTPMLKPVKKMPPVPLVPAKKIKKVLLPAPKKHITLKKVEDKNYADRYMYPEDTSAAKKDPSETLSPKKIQTSMNKEACIQMIGQEKFDRYTAMFRSEEASIKRCAMLKAMNH